VVWEGKFEGLGGLLSAGAGKHADVDVDELLDRWRFTFMSPTVERVLGYPVNEAMRLTTKKLLTPVSYVALSDAFAEELAVERNGADPQRQRTLELEHVMRDGGRRWCELTMRFQRDEAGQIVGVFGSTRDISERKTFERELSEITTRQQQGMGRELHDGLGQQLLGLRLMAGSLQNSLRSRTAMASS